MKKFMAALLGFLFIFSSFSLSPVTAEDTTPKRKLSMEEAITNANQELNHQYYVTPYQIKINGTLQTMELSEEIWDTRQILAYGKPTDICTSAKDIDTSKTKDSPGYYRYLGYTKNGDYIPDPEWEADHASTTLINNYKWVRKPWETVSKEDEWDGKLENLPYIKEGLFREYEKDIPKIYDPDIKPNNARGPGEDWHTVTKILQPRTSVTPGLARMWHNWNGAWWYITVVIPSVLSPDIELVSLNNSNPVYTETTQTTTVNYRNNSEKTETFEALFYVGDKLINKNTIALAVGRNFTQIYQWQTPKEPEQLILKAETLPLPAERNSLNNHKTLAIDVKGTPLAEEPKCLDCADAPSISNSWEELYTWQVYHPKTCCEPVSDDEDEKKKYWDCSWWETKYQTVEYNEGLSATLSINTKQGIATDPKKPKESDRESRASWDIIPYAKKKGLDPNEVTRAGYGFEVKLVTQYSNDWETKVPEGAEPHGGTYSGPTQAYVDFYNTKGRFVERVNLVPTKGKAGDKAITWELPEEKYKFQSGKTIYERKHYVDLRVPDGKYQVRVTVNGAGKTDLCLIRNKYVTIYGDMFDDDYTRIAREYE